MHYGIVYHITFSASESVTQSHALTKTIRGYTGHEHLPHFALINMNVRMYDPVLGRMLSPDNYVQDPNNAQNYNRYTYVLNNPLKYTDPSGEFFWVPVIVGAVIGAYSGGVIANNDYDPSEWDWESSRTWRYIIGGAIVGGVSGYVGAAVAASEIPMANTLSIMGASLTNSVGTYAYTEGQTDISMSFGVVSYNFSQNEWGYLGKEENSALENIGYGLGALANISDGVVLFDQIRANNRMNLTDAEKQVQYENNYREGWYDEYLGPNGNADPSVARANGHLPKTKLGEATYQHDINYYNKGADGVRGAVFDTKTLSADRSLISSARSIRQGFRSGADIALKTYKWAGKVRLAFVPLVGYKYTIINSYLFTPLMIIR